MTNTVSKTLCKKSNKQQSSLKNKVREANARRKVAKSWSFVANSTRYQKAAAKESCLRATSLMENELFDGILLNLNERNNVKPYNVQKRVLRRIVEKRQAQATHRMVGKSGNRFMSYLIQYTASKSMNDLRKHQQCA